MPPFARSGFHIQHPLTDRQVERLRASPQAWAAIRVNVSVILRSPFGEQRKDVSADVLALIDR